MTCRKGKKKQCREGFMKRQVNKTRIVQVKRNDDDTLYTLPRINELKEHEHFDKAPEKPKRLKEFRANPFNKIDTRVFALDLERGNNELNENNETNHLIIEHPNQQTFTMFCVLFQLSM